MKNTETESSFSAKFVQNIVGIISILRKILNSSICLRFKPSSFTKIDNYISKKFVA